MLHLARALIVLAAVATFARGVAAPLIPSWDDARFLIDNPDVHEISWRSFVSIVSQPHFEAYHPLHLLSYWLDVPWAGPSGPVIHAVSLGLWCAVLLVVLELFRKLGLDLVPATIATLLFGLHTVHVEAVTWASGRKEILAIGLASGSFLAHLCSKGSEQSGSERRSPNLWGSAMGIAPLDRHAWLSRALFALAALAKTSVLPLPLVLALHDLVIARRSLRETAIAHGPTFVLAGAISAVVIRIWQTNRMIRAASSGDSLLVPATLAHHLETAILPAWTSPIYPLTREQPIIGSWVLFWCAAMALALALAWRARASFVGSRVLLGLGMFLLFLAPVSNAIPLYYQWQDRYLCLPLLGLALAIGALIHGLGDRRTATVLASAAIVALALRTVQYQGAWQGDLALWEHAVRAQPSALYAWTKLGEVRRDHGDFRGARRAYGEAIELAPRLSIGYTGLFTALVREDEAERHLTPSALPELARRFEDALEDSIALRELAADLEEDGYREAVTYTLGRSFALQPVSDERLERAAQIQLEQGNEWLARFYVSQMQREPVLPIVQRYLELQRARYRQEQGADQPDQ